MRAALASSLLELKHFKRERMQTIAAAEEKFQEMAEMCRSYQIENDSLRKLLEDLDADKVQMELEFWKSRAIALQVELDQVNKRPHQRTAEHDFDQDYDDRTKTHERRPREDNLTHAAPSSQQQASHPPLPRKAASQRAFSLAEASSSSKTLQSRSASARPRSSSLSTRVADVTPSRS
mmetsp:Transcript_39326/g.93008  ORF Transcript_39326/g.93008 Transcript_39326/m.93008 type:complete len:178 (+) Transcript_39326:2-535(+)